MDRFFEIPIEVKKRVRPPVTEETRRKLSEAGKGRKCPKSPEHRAKIADGLTGKKLSAETKAKLVVTSTGRIKSESELAKMRAANLGKTISVEQRQKISASLMGHVGQPMPDHVKAILFSDETRDKIVAANTGKKRSDEFRARISEFRKQHMATSVDCNCASCNFGAKRRTDIEMILIDFLLREFENVREQYRVNRFCLDAFLPDYNLAFEADGAAWHLDKAKDDRRDQFLLDNYGIITIRLTDKELYKIHRQFKKMDRLDCIAA